MKIKDIKKMELGKNDVIMIKHGNEVSSSEIHGSGKVLKEIFPNNKFLFWPTIILRRFCETWEAIWHQFKLQPDRNPVPWQECWPIFSRRILKETLKKRLFYEQ